MTIIFFHWANIFSLELLEDMMTCLGNESKFWLDKNCIRRRHWAAIVYGVFPFFYPCELVHNVPLTLPLWTRMYVITGDWSKGVSNVTVTLDVSVFWSSLWLPWWFTISVTRLGEISPLWLIFKSLEILWGIIK